MKQYIVDAFTTELFKGNQAAVCVMSEWIPDSMMRNIAVENNFSETAFTVRQSDGSYKLRWFTPGGEIDFCGHATLGTSFVLFNFYEKSADKIDFQTQRENFSVYRTDDKIRMDFLPYKLNPVEVTDLMTQVFGKKPLEVYKDRDFLYVFDKEDFIRTVEPDYELMAKLDGLCICITARGSGKYDCVSRVFCPDLGVNEDPVTGSSHCMIAPYWAKKLGKKEITAFQASARTGELFCQVHDDIVSITGSAVLFSECELHI